MKMATQALLLIVIMAMTTPPTPASCSTTFTLQPLSLQPDFALQSIYTPAIYPKVNPEGEIFLTQDPSDSSGPLYNVGRIIYTQPLPIKDESNQVSSFITSFRFNITTTTKYNESGDGIAFVITTDKDPPQNSTGRFLGLMPEKPKDRHQQFMAIEFDTFQNLEAEILDPSASHIGIDISSLASIKPVLNSADPSHPLYLYNNYTITAWVNYNASTNLIQVWATNSSHQERPSDPILNSTQNLSRVFENHTNIYVGISAASGNNSQANILYSWNFTILAEQKRHQLSLGWILAIVFVSLIMLSLAITTAILVSFRRRQFTVSEQRRRAAIEGTSVFVHQYGYNELKRASQNFSAEQRIGKGGTSSVYKGVLRDNTMVAIKKMNDGLVEAETIAREVQIISKVKHRNLLELEGWCYERGAALLVYKYMPNSSLDSYLYGEKRRCGEELDSNARFKILLGVAAALEYLHGGLEECILHRDVKAANVLLTEMMEAKLGDFGLARLIAHDQMMTLTAAGTFGYVAPEVVHTGRVTEKVDVYGFGVLALEVACGQKALDPNSATYSRLADRVWLHSQNTTILDALDPSLADALIVPSSADVGLVSDQNTELQKWRCVLHLGLLCCQTEQNKRPCMREAHQALKDSIVLPLPDFWIPYPAPALSPTDREGTATSVVEFFSLPSDLYSD